MFGAIPWTVVEVSDGIPTVGDCLYQLDTGWSDLWGTICIVVLLIVARNVVKGLAGLFLGIEFVYSLKLVGLLLRRKVEVLLQIYGELRSGLLEGSTLWVGY
jgi:hypothetical protein